MSLKHTEAQNQNGHLDLYGYDWDSIHSEALTRIRKNCQPLLDSASKPFGIRGVVRQSEDLSKSANEFLLPIARKYLGSNAFIVRSILFDKPEHSNWAVPWHQDMTVEVLVKHEVPGFGPWSLKDGVDSVQPPTEILEKMLTLRLHLDDTDQDNGALIVDPGSHLNGKRPIKEIDPARPVVLECEAGTVLLMKPLLYHASNRSSSLKPRRVLHLDFAANPLPEPLVWMKS